ncbi:hypothetical protein [Vibrio crassostreae]|uniref:hypothetical protein n=1 Tax=Vibrio crassostreae TaxID=246167 RepID=UPI001B30F06B|nr:hypothetical protein [Vibrio crassostreae]
MLGLVGVLSSSLLAIVLVFVVMLLSYLSALLAPTEGEYKLDADTGLLFPIESFMLNEEIIGRVVAQYKAARGVHQMDVASNCTYGASLDKLTAGRYTAFNFVFLNNYKKNVEPLFESIETFPLGFEESKNLCYVRIQKASPDGEMEIGLPKSDEINYTVEKQ